ncbi:l1 transposable element-related [Holotrichia oblita]|uniref:L1 transposable element-related n=1 Tax=Holotrichia oblita TaxID=644536 RepID=A0ACB9T8S5_HOLOL|nr:l1 transposable element-related [Holotrichia oblita]
MLYIITVVSVICFFNNCLSETSASKYFIDKNRQNEKYNYKKDGDKNHTDYSPLTEFIERYVSKIYNNESRNTYTTFKPENLEISKFWATLDSPQNHNSSKNKQEWVTLEAIPWSISKVSKWERKNKYEDNNPWDRMQHLGNIHPNMHNHQEHNKSNQEPNPLIFDDTKFKASLKPWNQLPHSEVVHDTKNHYLDTDVITDGLLPNFPVAYGDLNQHYATLSTEKPAETYPLHPNGEWILLSTTKGYKRPKNKLRSLPMFAGSTHASVALTVLPMNISISQGDVVKVLKNPVIEPGPSVFKRKKRTKIVKTNIIGDNDAHSTNKVTSTVKKQNYLDSAAVAAAVGAGMIPATMALLVPFAMGSKKKRSIND